MLALKLAVFALVTTEFLPASLLPRIAADMGTTEGAAGQAVTATAVMGAVTAPTIAAPGSSWRWRSAGRGFVAAAERFIGFDQHFVVRDG